ncbi:phosphoribosylglycinamide formyltransferase [Candidatus Woesearchaeota archaeon]|nr:MAG: phosphoribosylglycinamide formyltransferase [Candidatus Woesearchaeota archaeon]
MTLKIGILASTRGSDIPAVLEAIKDKVVDAEVSIIIANKECGALAVAEAYGIPHKLILSKGMEREAYDRLVAEELEKHGVELVLLIGYMRYLSEWFVNKYRNRIMNIHPSLLPAFAGGMDLNVHQLVLDSGVKVTGCTLHFVDEGADTGPIILQATVPVEEGDTPETLKEKVQAQERKLLVEGIKLYIEGRLKVEGNKVRILGKDDNSGEEGNEETARESDSASGN